MNFIISIFVILVPLIILVFPGLAIFGLRLKRDNMVQTTAQIILSSLSLLVLGSLLVTAIGLPPATALVLAGLFTIGMLFYKRPKFTLVEGMSLAGLIGGFMLLYLAFSLPFLFLQDGLPTGDAQKAILWAQEIQQTSSLPHYSQSLGQFNRDPVDFYTPGLHTLTALALQSVPQAFTFPTQLTTVGFLAIALALAAALISLALAQAVLPEKYKGFAYLAPVFVLTNIRFLRYLREPGYHFQNIAGELFLIGLLLLTIRLLKTWRWPEAILVVLTGLALALTHQFTAFIAVFILLPIFITNLISKKSSFISQVTHHRLRAAGLSALLISLVVAGFALGLHEKIPHIFTTDPHLLNLTPSLLDYPRLMGLTWLLLGFCGLLVMTYRESNLGFVLSAFIILALSQGPRLGIDIPPVRALFYSVIPLSVSAAYLIGTINEHIRIIKDARQRRLAYLILVLLIFLPAYTSVARAYDLDQNVRTNSTLTPEQLILIDFLQARDSSGAALVDDYNRRSSSWLSLAGRGMFTRIAADLERQMNEANQSSLRRQLYLKQLDFEKIFALGSRPEISQLMRRHNIAYLTGIIGSSDSSFSHNPALREVARAGDIVLYTEPAGDAAGGPPAAGALVPPDGGVPRQDPRPKLTNWLLKPSTLANDIGDREDTFEHLPASLRATRLSDPQYAGPITYRTTTAPFIPLKFNIGQFTRILWDQDNTGQPDISVELVINLLNQPTGLTIITPTQKSYSLISGLPLTIAAADVPFDDDGFITIMIDNPEQAEIAIDLIALGISHVP